MEKDIICCTAVQEESQPDSRRQNMRKWLLLIIMTYATFIFNTTEFMPIGLLSDIAADFGISEASASLLISAYAWFVAIMSLPLMLAMSRFDFRSILLGVVALFAASHFLSAIASNFTFLLLSRLGVACSHAIFWSIMSPLAMEIAPDGKRETALGMILTGTSFAMVVGLPLGRAIGLYSGWRFSFGIIGFAALLALVLLAFLFPRIPNKQQVNIQTLPTMLKSPVISSLYLFTFLLVTAHYTGYSYIEPFLTQVAGMSNDWVTLSLTVYGIAGIGGSVLFSRYFGKNRRLFFLFVPIGMMLTLFMMRSVAFSTCSALFHCMIWGMLFMLFNLIVEFEVIRYAPQCSTIAVAVFSSIFNIGIGCGTLVGGMALTEFSTADVGYIGGCIAIVTVVFSFLNLYPRLKISPKEV